VAAPDCGFSLFLSFLWQKKGAIMGWALLLLSAGPAVQDDGGVFD
jgi:hypothetical protein